VGSEPFPRRAEPSTNEVRDLDIVAVIAPTQRRRSLTVSDGIGLAEKMLGLPGLVVLDVEESVGEVIVRVESTRSKATCPWSRSRHSRRNPPVSG
jgi:hypothetical protein